MIGMFLTVSSSCVLHEFIRRQAMYVHYNVTFRRVRATIDWGKSIRITCCECVFVALGIQHEMRMRHIVFCGLPRSTILFYITS
jgi:hypothetical protein